MHKSGSTIQELKDQEQEEKMTEQPLKGQKLKIVPKQELKQAYQTAAAQQKN